MIKITPQTSLAQNGESIKELYDDISQLNISHLNLSFRDFMSVAIRVQFDVFSDEVTACIVTKNPTRLSNFLEMIKNNY